MFLSNETWGNYERGEWATVGLFCLTAEQEEKPTTVFCSGCDKHVERCEHMEDGV